MLVFFIHGVATRDVNYAETLKNLIKEEFLQRNQTLPHFRSSFWGNVLRDVDKMWNWIEQDLQDFKKDNPQSNLDDIFRYKKFREGLLSQFIGDVLTYLNSECGAEIRKIIAQDLYKFIQKHPEETELHIVAHSLGTVILWDVLFSDRFTSKDPAFYIRELINGLAKSDTIKKITLKSITTIGSPILFLNTMLAVKPEQIHNFAANYQDAPFQWTNIIHSSDIIAYPIRASLNLQASSNLILRDEYISDDANALEKAARSLGQIDAAMALGITDAHVGYFKCQKTTRLIIENLLGKENLLELGDNMMQTVMTRLRKVRGMTTDQSDNAKVATVSATFKDGSGTIRLFVNTFQVHHIYVFDKNDICKFGGYVGWIDTLALQEELDLIQRKFC